MEEFWQLFKTIVNPESIIYYGGLYLLVFVIFAETGLFVGFFLPGDSLLFTAGLLTATGNLQSPIIVVLLSISVAAIVGNLTGYYFGKKVGPPLFSRKESLMFKPAHLNIARQFFNKHGDRAMILGRFLPIVRTFVPIVAGVISYDFRKFMISNILGALLWVFSLVLLGYFAGVYIPWVKDFLEYIVIALIVLTTIPVYRTYLKEKKASVKPN
ncbi:MAG TPA: alkaline phosphatase [Bacteroidales bacterium]|nr:alkaline phosphatase [Bacteroidales bacterium]